jgi:hypothetical protein
VTSRINARQIRSRITIGSRRQAIDGRVTEQTLAEIAEAMASLGIQRKNEMQGGLKPTVP